jgi:hypothetical protein
MIGRVKLSGPWLLAAGLLGATGTAGVIAANSTSTTPPPLYISPNSPGGLSDKPDLDAVAARVSVLISSTSVATTTSTTPRRPRLDDSTTAVANASIPNAARDEHGDDDAADDDRDSSGPDSGHSSGSGSGDSGSEAGDSSGSGSGGSPRSDDDRDNDHSAGHEDE